MGTDSPTPLRLTPVALGAAVLVLCALVAATFDGPRWSASDGSPEESAVSEEERREEARSDTARDEGRTATEDDEPWLPWAPPVDLLLLVPTTLVLGVALAVLARLRVVRRRRRPATRPAARTTLAHEEPPPDEVAEPVLPRALDAGTRVVGEGSPRNAIVATWVLLEQAVEGDRFPRRPEETPSELVARALASYRLDGAAIRRLAALYREARFSAHPVTEEHRDEAADCLRRLLATIRTTAR